MGQQVVHIKKTRYSRARIDITVETLCRSIIGKYGLQKHEINAHTTLTEYE